MPAGSRRELEEVTKTVQIEPAVAGASAKTIAPGAEQAPLISVRSSPGGYLVAALALTLLALLLIRAEYDEAAIAALISAWLLTPLAAFTDRIRIEGRVLSRTGLVAFVHKIFKGRALKLDIDEVEQVETYAVRTLRRGGSVRYRYRSEVVGRGLIFAFASGGNYRHMVRCLFALIRDEKLDARSRELRDYLTDPRSLRETVKLLRIAPASVLEGALLDFRLREKKSGESVAGLSETAGLSSSEKERGQLLRAVANQLRAAGRLREAAEGFRRALLVTPQNAWLLFEFARFLRSQASALSDARLLSRSRAALRLAARHASEDAQLISRIAESFFEFGDVGRAARLFRRALELQPRSYRAETGLAEIALRSGKLAHVIHHYQAATRIAPDEAAARYTRREADYYALLNDDDEYLEAELKRINWLQTLQTVRRWSARIMLTSVLLAIGGAYVGGAGDDLSAIGWSLTSSSLVAWVCTHSLSKLLSRRRRPHTAE
jgi:tetratricopeptide (TPR) repeat protein